MSNTVNYITNMVPVLDEVYKKAGVTSVLDYSGPLVRETNNAKTIQLAKRTLQGLGTYGRQNAGSGYPAGDVALTWETHTFSQDRGREFNIDRFDNDETGGAIFGQATSVAAQLTREYIAPEIDAYRFATMASTSGILTVTGATLSASTIKAAIDTAIETMDDAEVPEEGRTLFVVNECYTYMKNTSLFTYNLDASAGNGINTNVPTYEGMPVIKVPKSRFYTAITLYDGTTSGQTAGGYIKNASTGKDINFMIVHSSAVAGITKIAMPKYFSPDVNQDADSHKFQHRLYHDLFVFEDKVKGIYLHKKAQFL